MSRPFSDRQEHLVRPDELTEISVIFANTDILLHLRAFGLCEYRDAVVMQS